MNIKQINEEFERLLEDNEKTLDLSFESESGWINHVTVNLDNALYQDIEKYDINFNITQHTISDLEGYEEHFIDAVNNEIKEYVDDILVLTAFYGNKDNYYSALLFDGGDNDLLYNAIKNLVDVIKEKQNN